MEKYLRSIKVFEEIHLKYVLIEIAMRIQEKLYIKNDYII